MLPAPAATPSVASVANEYCDNCRKYVTAVLVGDGLTAFRPLDPETETPPYDVFCGECGDYLCSYVEER